MKELVLIRDARYYSHVEGRLLLDGNELCKTFEPAFKEHKENEGCIPIGEYQGASIAYKNDTVYRLLDTTTRSGILIKVGNTVQDTKGDILVGKRFGKLEEQPAILESRAALQGIINTVGHAIALKVCWAESEEEDIIYKNNSFVDIDNREQAQAEWKIPDGCAISVNENLMRRGVDVLHPVTKKKVQKMLELCKAVNLKVLILDTLRTESEQNKLYNQSRTVPPTGPKVTNAKGVEGVHVWGCAVDFCLNVRGQEYADTSFFAKVGSIAESVGLEWGGRWKSPDRPHVQDSETLGDTSTRFLIEKYGTFEHFKETW